ncbi:MAG TPA: 23S rRNA (adenine(2503)-C(2))-methyltransferase RlmN [Elusimicrobiales bacterium]|nr:23S rRNA (adenine(2503)-C(2))-methyltransferase RlmN [Elusimicrobiales bacterium]
MNLEALKDYLAGHGIKNYRLEQIRKAVYSQAAASWDEMTALPAELREELAPKFPILSLKMVDMRVSRHSGARKALLELKDGARIETVLLNTSSGWSVCVSSQAGCSVRCVFCATGKAGFKRNLSAQEIEEQVLFWLQHVRKEHLAERISTVVYMGMGEPFLNYKEVVQSVHYLSSPERFGIGQRHISISTCGFPRGIVRLAGDLPQVNLALSLHSVDELERSRMIPVNRRFGLEELKKALSIYIKKTKREVFLEYAVMKGHNDSPAHARKLIEWIRSIPGAYLLHVNLIPCNRVRGSRFEAELADAERFAARLEPAGVKTTVRRSLGPDIGAACGQLAGGAEDKR